MIKEIALVSLAASIVSLNFLGLLYLTSINQPKEIIYSYKIDFDVLRRKIEFRRGEIKDSKNPNEKQETFELDLLNQYILDREKKLNYYSTDVRNELRQSEFLHLKGNHPIILKFIKFD